ncbi:MAG TPA: hypothetical protein VH724_13105, partial [Candidatus Angelobacter sp.]|nr:hypothetical protein [Candidatus Angelobacter sp.]
MSTATHLEHMVTINGKQYKSIRVAASSLSATSLPPSPAGTTQPQPSLNGRLLQPEGSPYIAFIWWGGPFADPNGIGGYACHVPDPTTALALFGPDFQVTPLPAALFNTITSGPALTGSPDHAVLALGDQSPTVYLVTNGTKNPVASPPVMSLPTRSTPNCTDCESRTVSAVRRWRRTPAADRFSPGSVRRWHSD